MAHQAAVITCSDRASDGVYGDESGPIIQEGLRAAGFEVGDVVLVRDDVDSIREAIESLVHAGVRVVITTGGTGIAPRDVTVEATLGLLDFEMPGIAEEVRRVGMQKVPTAQMSRAVAGVMTREDNRAFVANAPGSKGGAKDTITVLGPILGHIVAQMDGVKNH